MISLEAHVKSIQGVIGTSERVTSQTGKLSLAFCFFTSALCEFVCPICCCLSLLYKENRYGVQATTSF